MSDSVVFYHDNCCDGFGAAYAYWKKYPTWDYHGVSYDAPPPEPEMYRDRHVYFVDFTYPYEIMNEICTQARRVTVLDHHITAEKILHRLYQKHKNFNFTYRVQESGAMLAWKHVWDNKAVPKVIEHIQDRDLWKFKLKGTDEIHAYLMTYPRTFRAWDNMMNSSIDFPLSNGGLLLKMTKKQVSDIIAATRRQMQIGHWFVPVCNSSVLQSEIGNVLAKSTLQAFGAVYSDTPEGRRFSLRSIGSFNVAEVASRYGGGGHKNAAGFTVDRDHELARA